MRIDVIQDENTSGSICADDAAAPGPASTYRRMSSSIIDDLCKSEKWSEFKKKFAEIGIHDQTIDSLALIPLLETAIDDGVISSEEKNKIIRTMKNIGILKTGIDPGLNNLWAPFKGRTSFLIVWTVYLRDVSRQMLSQEKAAFKIMLTEAWEFMARTMGGFLQIRDLDARMTIAIESVFYRGEEKDRAPDTIYHNKGVSYVNENQGFARSQAGF